MIPDIQGLVLILVASMGTREGLCQEHGELALTYISGMWKECFEAGSYDNHVASLY